MEDFNKSEKKLKDLQEWIKTQPQLPQKIERGFLKLFLHAKNGDLEEAKQLVETNYKFRLKHENLFLNRDPLDKATYQQLEIESMIQLPGKTPDNHKIFLNRLIDFDPAKHDFDESIKVFFMMVDLIAIDDEEDYAGETIIFDMTGVTWRHQLKTSLSTVRIFMKAVQEAYPFRPKEIHVINANSIIEVIVRMVRPFMRGELFSKLQIHLPNSEKPYEHFPRDMMPEEYGGKAGKIADLNKQWMALHQKYRDYLMDDGRWRYNPL